MNASQVVELFPKAVAVGPVACLACGKHFGGRPEATSYRKRGDYAIVAEWHICSCGAFVRSERVARAAAMVAEA